MSQRSGAEPYSRQAGLNHSEGWGGKRGENEVGDGGDEFVGGTSFSVYSQSWLPAVARTKTPVHEFRPLPHGVGFGVLF